jgi:hypothetical protein
MVVAAAGLGSVLAAYIDVLPSPIQQLAHGAFAAPAPHGSSSRLSATLGMGQRAPHKVQPSAQPAPAARHSANALVPVQGTAATPHYRSRFPAPDHYSTEAACSPGRSPYQFPEPGGSTPPPWYQKEPCAATPTGPASLPTREPHLP